MTRIEIGTARWFRILYLACAAFLVCVGTFSILRPGALTERLMVLLGLGGPAVACVWVAVAPHRDLTLDHGGIHGRPFGQPAIISLAYGLIAGSLAAITGGFVYSDDSAWDWERMPARPEEFLKFYFRPDQALESDFQSWSRECIALLGTELQDPRPPR